MNIYYIMENKNQEIKQLKQELEELKKKYDSLKTVKEYESKGNKVYNVVKLKDVAR